MKFAELESGSFFIPMKNVNSVNGDKKPLHLYLKIGTSTITLQRLDCEKVRISGATIHREHEVATMNPEEEIIWVK